MPNTDVATPLHILGVRHHGPGSARSVVRALEQLKPDCLLIEGPPDGDELIAHAVKDDMRPPVAMLVHDAEQPSRAVYYPYAEFSPEWQAIRWALRAKVPVRFMDLPQWHRIPIEAERIAKLVAEMEKLAAEAQATEGDGASDDDASTPAGPAAPMTIPDPDPLQELAKAAGFDDGERWWEHAVEHRRHDDAQVFVA